MAKATTKLELKSPEFSTRTVNFFNLMNLETVQNSFFENPASVITKELGIRIPSATVVSNTNKMVFSLLSDKNFNTWAKTFQSEIEQSFPDLNNIQNMDEIVRFAKVKANQEKFKADFAASVINHLDPSSIKGIIKDGIVTPGLINAEGDVAVVLLTFIAVIVILLVVAGVTRPLESLSRMNVNLIVNQINKQQQAIAQKQLK